MARHEITGFHSTEISYRNIGFRDSEVFSAQAGIWLCRKKFVFFEKKHSVFRIFCYNGKKQSPGEEIYAESRRNRI